jgi:hypothetical protein
MKPNLAFPNLTQPKKLPERMLDAILSSTCEQADRRVGELQPKKKRKEKLSIQIIIKE